MLQQYWGHVSIFNISPTIRRTRVRDDDVYPNIENLKNGQASLVPNSWRIGAGASGIEVVVTSKR